MRVQQPLSQVVASYNLTAYLYQLSDARYELPLIQVVTDWTGR